MSTRIETQWGKLKPGDVVVYGIGTPSETRWTVDKSFPDPVALGFWIVQLSNARAVRRLAGQAFEPITVEAR